MSEKKRRRGWGRSAFSALLPAAGIVLVLSGNGEQRPILGTFFDDERVFVPNEILVCFRPGASDRPDLFCAAIGASLLDQLPEIGVLRLRTPDPVGLGSTLQRIREYPEVLYAEPNFILQAADIEPRDPLFPFQWGLQNTGQIIGPPELGLPWGTDGADIKAVEAWELDKGESVLVGVIDTGVDLSHPDLIGRIASSGWDFVNDDDVANDDHGHGSLVAGIIAADTDNGIGISGLNWNGRILPVKVFNDNAKGTVFNVVAGILWAVDHGARVLNMSLGGPDIVVSKTLEDAVSYAAQRDVVMVAAAGNDGLRGVWRPAAYPDVLAVAAVDMNDVYQTLQTTGGVWGSNFGPEVDVAAPAVQVLSSWPDHVYMKDHLGLGTTYAYGNKTSMATAFGSGAAALIRSFRPELTAAQIRRTLEETADDINASQFPGRDDYLGYGRINLGRALRSLDQLDPPLSLTGVKTPPVPFVPKNVSAVLRWEANPKNDRRGLRSYRIYRREGPARTLLADLASSILYFIDARVPLRKSLTYEIAAVNDVGVEGMAASVSIHLPLR